MELPTITITGVRPAAEANPREVLDPEKLRATVTGSGFERPRFTDPVLLERDWGRRVVQRAGEAEQGLELARSRRAALKDLRETYRRTSVDDALNRLVPTASLQLR